jgi:L-threonine kinase
MGSLATVSLPATCGELVQGTLDGIPCLVSCPINLYSMAQVSLTSAPGWEVPRHAPKTAAALHAGLAYLGGVRWGGRLRLLNQLPRGRGYGSSTADIGAALFALSQALGRKMSPEKVAGLAVGVEPSDSSIFPGLTLFDHRDGRFYESLGSAPPISVVVIDPGGEVDTLDFNSVDRCKALRRLAPQHYEAFSLLRQGLESREWQAVGEAATLSACLHQSILPSPLLDPVLALAREVKALGVCRAHSGTLLGLLLDPLCADVDSAADFVGRCVPDTVTVTSYTLVNGGPRHPAGVDRPIRSSQTTAKPAIARR